MTHLHMAAGVSTSNIEAQWISVVLSYHQPDSADTAVCTVPWERRSSGKEIADLPWTCVSDAYEETITEARDDYLHLILFLFFCS